MLLEEFTPREMLAKASELVAKWAGVVAVRIEAAPIAD